MILVTGATGTVGQALAGALAQSGIGEMRLLVRSPDRVSAIAGASIVICQFADEEAMARALHGVSALFLLTKPTPDQPRLEAAIAALAARQGVKRIVRMSVMAADSQARSPVRRWHGECEAAVKASGIPVANLRANFFMQNLLGFARGIALRGQFSVPAGEARISMVDVRDIADCAARLLIQSDFQSIDATITGPEAVSFADIAEMIGAARGAPVHYRNGDIPAFVARLTEGGAQPGHAAALGALYEDFQAGLNTAVNAAVPRIIGRPARTIAAFIAENAARFAPSSSAVQH